MFPVFNPNPRVCDVKSSKLLLKFEEAEGLIFGQISFHIMAPPWPTKITTTTKNLAMGPHPNKHIFGSFKTNFVYAI